MKENGAKYKKDFGFKYSFPSQFVGLIEEPILNDGLLFIPKILLTEDDFVNEGLKMKNCMAHQFIMGTISIFISLSQGKKTVDLQYRRGELSQSYGKANSPVIDKFKPVIEILSNKIRINQDIKWKREKYEIIK